MERSIREKEEEFERIKDVMPRWHLQSFNEKKNAWEVSPIGNPSMDAFFLPMFHTKMHADAFLSQAKIRGSFCQSIRVACIDSEKCLSWFCKEVEYIEDRVCERTGKSYAEALPIVVDYKFPDNLRQEIVIKEKDMAFNSFLGLMTDCVYRGKEKEKKTVEKVAPRYCVMEDAFGKLQASVYLDAPRLNRVFLAFYTSKELAKKSIDAIDNGSYSAFSTPKSIRCLGEDLSVADYFDAVLRALMGFPDLISLGLPEKPNFWDVVMLPVLVDACVSAMPPSALDNALILSELMGRFPEIWSADFTPSEITYYKGYTVFIHQHIQDQDFACVVCKGTFKTRDEARGAPNMRVMDYTGTKENIERRVKAWIDQQAIIDEKNQRKAERKAQREEQAEVNKPFKWFAPTKFGIGVSGAVEHDGTIVKKSSKETSDFVTISNTIGNLWDALGNRRWFVNGDIVKFIKHANVPDTRMDGLFFPYDCFYVIFENSADPERRFMIRNRTIQYLRVVRVKSEQACRLIKDDSIVPLFMPYKCVISIVTSTDSSKEVFEGAVFIDIADSSKIPEGVGSAEEKAQIQRIVVALLLLYSGRVEIFKQYTIPRSQRYELNKGIKDQHKDNNEIITMMPLKKLVVEDPKPSDGTGPKKKTHMRGWCLDTLRHPRYKRNPDGTLRTRIRPPCIINDPEKEV